jgi:MFS transporter
MRTLRRGAFADRQFLKLWSGSVVSTLGFHVSVLAMQLTAAVVLDASPLQMGLLAAAQLAPRVALGLVVGAWIDRLRKRPVLIAADLGRAALLGSVPIAHLAGWLRVEQLYVVALGLAALGTFFEVAIVSYLPRLVGRERLVEANSAMHAGDAVAQIAGPSVAGALVQALTAPIALAADAVSYVVSALCIGWIGRQEPAPAPMPPDRSVVAEVRAGMRFVIADPCLRPLVASAAWYGFFAGGARGALVVLYLVELGLSPLEFGLVYSVGGGAALAGAVLAQRTATRLGLGRMLVTAHVLVGVGSAFVPLAGLVSGARLLVLVTGQAVASLAAPLWSVSGTSLQQAVVPDRLLGRVGATFHFASFVFQPAAAVAAGWVAAQLGLQATLACIALAIAGGSGWLLLSPVRGLKHPPRAPARHSG